MRMAPRLLRILTSVLLLLAFVHLLLHSEQYRLPYKSDFLPHVSSSSPVANISEGQNATTMVVEDVKAFQAYSIEEEIGNSTLGFEKILAISLPERTDRRQLLGSMALAQHVSIEWMDAVRGEDLPITSWPQSWNTTMDGKPLSKGEVGNWKSHRNALQRIVDSGHSSALILEDDADWDVALKRQLIDFARAARTLENLQRAEDDRLKPGDQGLSPYGSRWDILFLGTCANPPAGIDAEIFPGIGPEQHYVYPIKGGTACTYAYAVTQASARSLLLFLEDTTRPTDFALSESCASQDRECVIVWPMLTSSYKAAGLTSKDSDIGHDLSTSDDNDSARLDLPVHFREKGESWKIEHSATSAFLESSIHR